MSPMVQTAKIVAVAAVSIAGMLSFALVFSAWLSSSNNAACQYSSPSIEASQPLAQALKSVLMGARDLDSAESKVENAKKDSSEEDDRDGVEDAAITMFKLPLELNLQEHMLEKNQRSHMNCIIEKKKAEEIVDEQSKPLPPLLGINMSTDPRYLHFTGEKVAISCHSGNDEQRGPPVPVPLVHGMMMPPHGPPPPFHHMHHQQQQQQQQQYQQMPMQIPSGSGNIPIHIIGPIPLTGHPGDIGQPLTSFQAPHQMHPNLIPIIIQQGQASEEGPIFLPPPLPEQQHSNEIRERALHHPVPIMPRQHSIEHIIRPRSTDAVDKKRVKRCACDCACKNHHES